MVKLDVSANKFFLCSLEILTKSTFCHVKKDRTRVVRHQIIFKETKWIREDISIKIFNRTLKIAFLIDP